ncbi:Txe/YoeB family addiction module toxin [Vibrio jasicida]|uniref:Txe/YoeB family addiction module toxin n=1 Tax=Vibrio jasicida TaxID=766224 RepID=UPI000CE57302|nr:Txe/YoeB family addiction module toxin [Vibrio jasicida]
MSLTFTPQAWEDYQYWIARDKKILKCINNLITDTKRQPNDCVGKAEPLKASLMGYWSRRITEVHRLVYKYAQDIMTIVSLRLRYQ